MIQVDVAGPRLPRTYDIIPNEVRHMADEVLNSCVTGPFEIGGFATTDLQVMNGWITAEETELDRPFRTSYLKLLCIGERLRSAANVLNFSSNVHRLPHSYPRQRSPRLAVPRKL